MGQEDLFSEMLSKAGLQVSRFDISTKMIKLAVSRVKGSFVVSDMLEYNPEGRFTGVLIVFSHLQLSYADFHTAAFKFANVLEPGGILVIGQMPIDSYIKDDSDCDETKTYVEDYPAPFMEGMLPTFAMSAAGQLQFLQSIGLDIVSSKVDTFHPNNEKCAPEEQQYVIARRPDDRPLRLPKSLP